MWLGCENDKCKFFRSFDTGSGSGGKQKYCCAQCRQHAYRERKRLREFIARGGDGLDIGGM